MKFFDIRSGFRIFGFTILAASLGGCASYFTSPSETIGYTKFGAEPAPPAPGTGTTAPDKIPRAPGKDATVLQFAADTFADALRDSANASSDNTRARDAIIAGRSLLNLRCSDYLDQIGLKNQRAANERRHVDIVGGFTSAIMGLTGSSAKAVAGVASSFSFAGSSLDSASATFLFSDASKAINRLVRDAQEKYVAKLNEYEGD